MCACILQAAVRLPEPRSLCTFAGCPALTAVGAADLPLALQCATFLGWITGMHPPGKILACITAGKVVMHKLQAHCEAYEAIKRTPLGKGLQVRRWGIWGAL
jgi:hypothetical protein